MSQALASLELAALALVLALAPIQPLAWELLVTSQQGSLPAWILHHLRRV
jgi:hypothetical protein